jgi:hypothetical protein
MPPPLPLNADGFEDPDEFFKSPNTTYRHVGEDTTYGQDGDDAVIQSIVSALRRTPGAVVELSEEERRRQTITKTHKSASGRKRGRMSGLGGDSDDEEVAGGGDDLLGEEDEGFDNGRFGIYDEEWCGG